MSKKPSPGETEATVEQKTPATETPDDSATVEDSSDTITLELAQYEALQTELKQATEKAEAQWDVAIRAKAELENVRRRAEKDVASAHKFGTERLLNELLPVMDSLDQGIANTAHCTDNAAQALSEGMMLTHKMLLAALEKFHVQVVDPVGEAFNPSQHEAMSMQEDANAAPGTILQVIQKGYMLNERLLRPARVIVAKASTSKIDETA